MKKHYAGDTSTLLERKAGSGAAGRPGSAGPQTVTAPTTPPGPPAALTLCSQTTFLPKAQESYNWATLSSSLLTGVAVAVACNSRASTDGGLFR